MVLQLIVIQTQDTGTPKLTSKSKTPPVGSINTQKSQSLDQVQCMNTNTCILQLTVALYLPC